MNARWKYLLTILGLVTATAWLAYFTSPTQELQLIACDVGQGDAILAQVGSAQVLVDGGQGNRVLSCLSEFMPFWDREIEVVLLTHPQTDHFGGLIEVFESYQVGVFLANSLDSSSQGYAVLKNAVGGSNTEVVNPTSGMKIGIGAMHLEIVWPNTELAKVSSSVSVLGAFTSSKDANDFSIVANLRYGDFDALLTGDIGLAVINDVVEQLVLSDSRSIEYLKIPHHGSKNGLTKELLDQVEPEIAVISAGSNNRYGHPHKEVLEMLNKKGVRTQRTDLGGNVVIESDGKSWWVEAN